MLDYEIDKYSREEMFRDYIGQALWHITTIQHLKTTAKNDMPQYVELAHPKDTKKGPQTADEVFEYVLNGLGSCSNAVRDS